MYGKRTCLSFYDVLKLYFSGVQDIITLGIKVRMTSTCSFDSRNGFMLYKLYSIIYTPLFENGLETKDWYYFLYKATSEIKASFAPDESFLMEITSCRTPSGMSIRCPIGTVCQYSSRPTFNPKCVKPEPSNCPNPNSSFSNDIRCCQGQNCNL